MSGRACARHHGGIKHASCVPQKVVVYSLRTQYSDRREVKYELLVR